MVKRRKLLLFGVTKLEDMMEKGNVWYVRHYEQGFDEVVCIYLTGSYPDVKKLGSTTLISVSSGKGLRDLFLAPFRLYRQYKLLKPTHVVTADMFYSFWTSLLITKICKARVALMPVCLPRQFFK